MIPQRLELENFLSFGQPGVELSFADESLWVLSGPNGVGKSAVFDAITFALFGQHRGGQQNADRLIRHGANGFRVVFEFSFGGTAYRITRTRTGTRPTQRVEGLEGATGEWVELDLNTYRTSQRSDAVRDWAEATMGIGFEAFTASVLLRQGEADAMITGRNAERLALLKKVIGVERFEEVSNRVHEEARRRKTVQDTLERELKLIEAVGEEAIAAAEQALRAAETAQGQAREEAARKATRLEQAKNWEKWTRVRSDLKKQIDDAQQLTAQAEQIRADKERLDTLGRVVSSLRAIVVSRDALVAKLPDGVEDLARAQEVADAWMRGEQERFAGVVVLVEEAEKKAATCRAIATRVNTLLEQARQQQKRLEAEGVGVPCSACGQLVTEEHAQAERERLEANITQHEVEGKAAKAELEEAERTLKQCRKAQVEQDKRLKETMKYLTTHATTVVSRLEQLDAEWRERARTLTLEEVGLLEDEAQGLRDAGVVDQFARLKSTEDSLREWTGRMEALETNLEQIPEESRVSEKEAKADHDAAQREQKQADGVRDQAAKQLDELKRRADQYRDKTERLRNAERDHRLHRRLDEMLGKSGLQRELVRSGEREIVRLANETASNLSYGDLSIELESDGEDGSDEAFALQVRLGDGATPIPVQYLSGSQKFRVAISVALAMGQFASNQARPLESVIIDEGFGCLDRDGLNATAEELMRLREHLQRIILVSHQEEFAGRFPGGYRLRRSVNGTQVERYLQ